MFRVDYRKLCRRWSDTAIPQSIFKIIVYRVERMSNSDLIKQYCVSLDGGLLDRLNRTRAITFQKFSLYALTQPGTSQILREKSYDISTSMTRAAA